MDSNNGSGAENVRTLDDLMKAKRRRKASALGGLVALFAVIGLITTLVAGVRLARKIAGRERELQNFESLITPLVMCDPVPFNSISDAGDATMLQAAMWKILLSSGSDVYATDQDGLVIIPASDLTKAATELFGSGAQLVHQSFTGSNVTFTYDESSKTYRVPSRCYLGAYEPEVLDYTEEEGFTVLQVRYNTPDYLWNYDKSGDPESSRTYYYTLLKNKSGYYITGVFMSDPFSAEE